MTPRDTHALRRQLRQERREDRLTPLELRALVAIDRRPLPLDRLADFIGARPAQLRPAVDRLLALGRVREAHGRLYTAGALS
jgi:DNA-binding MarR family transcriptional regulator